MATHFVKSQRNDAKKPILTLKHDLLTTNNYRNLINTYLQQQVMMLQDQYQLPQKRSITLQPFVKYLGKFKYKQALNVALEVFILPIIKTDMIRITLMIQL